MTCLCHVSGYVTQTTLQTRRKYSLLDTRGSVSGKKKKSLFLKVGEREREKNRHPRGSNHKLFFYCFQSKRLWIEAAKCVGLTLFLFSASNYLDLLRGQVAPTETATKDFFFSCPDWPHLSSSVLRFVSVTHGSAGFGSNINVPLFCPLQLKLLETRWLTQTRPMRPPQCGVTKTNIFLLWRQRTNLLMHR